MKKLNLLLILILISLSANAQINDNPSKFNNGIETPKAVAETIISDSVSAGGGNFWVDGNFINYDPTGYFNLSYGNSALENFPESNLGFANTAIGIQSLKSMGENCSYNTAVGYGAFFKAGNNNKTNVVIGSSIFQNSGDDRIGNISIGNSSMGFAGSDIKENTALGRSALRYADSSNYNVSIGAYSMGSQDSDDFNGERNTAIGYAALSKLENGDRNNAVGDTGLKELRNGNKNTANGNNSLGRLKNGNNNVALGYESGLNLKKGDYNVYIGNINASNDTISNEIRIGDGGGNLIFDADGISKHVEFKGTVEGQSAVEDEDFVRLKKEKKQHLESFTVGSLPSSPDVGDQYIVTDANNPAWNQTVSGEGSDKVVVYWNGKTWVAH